MPVLFNLSPASMYYPDRLVLDGLSLTSFFYFFICARFLLTLQLWCDEVNWRCTDSFPSGLFVLRRRLFIT